MSPFFCLHRWNLTWRNACTAKSGISNYPSFFLLAHSPIDTILLKWLLSYSQNIHMYITSNNHVRRLVFLIISLEWTLLAMAVHINLFLYSVTIWSKLNRIYIKHSCIELYSLHPELELTHVLPSQVSMQPISAPWHVYVVYVFNKHNRRLHVF